MAETRKSAPTSRMMLGVTPIEIFSRADMRNADTSLFGLFHQAHDCNAAIEQQATRFGRGYPARMAHEKFNAEHGLEIADLQTKRGLRDIQPFSSFRHIAGFNRLDEITELFQIDSVTSS